jgi:hypothetical protein
MEMATSRWWAAWGKSSWRLAAQSFLRLWIEAHDGPSGGDDDEELLGGGGGVGVVAVDGANGHGDGAPPGGEANVGGEEGDISHEAGVVEGGIVGGGPGVGLEDLDLGVVGGDEDLGFAVAVEVGD